jgi:transcriptional regulator GlxA family with amidase domain
MAAVATGFADQAHMTRTFGRVLGLTPKGYQLADRPRKAAPTR